MRTPACPQTTGLPPDGQGYCTAHTRKGNASEYHIIKFMEGHAASSRVELPMSENLGIKMFGRCLVALRRVWTIHTRQPDHEDAESLQKLANRVQATGADMSPWG